MKNFTLKLFLMGLLLSGVFMFSQTVQAQDLSMFNGEIRLLDGDFVYQLNNQTYNLSANDNLLKDLAVVQPASKLNFAKLTATEIQPFLGKIIKTTDDKLFYVFAHNGEVMEIAYPDWQMSLWQIDQINAAIPRGLGGFDQSVETEILEAAQIVPAQIVLPELSALQQLADLINQERAQYQLPALTVDDQLSTVAQDKVDEMKRLDYFHHVSPTGTTPGKRLDSFKYSWSKMGENLAKTHSLDATAQQVFQLWKNSATHYANMISKDYQMLGLAKNGQFWAQELVRK
jgi:hypothetical protein